MQANIREIINRIRRNSSQLTKTQKMIADYIVENPHTFAISSVRELEKELHISKSTIVRFSQMLGYDGFFQLRSQFLSSIRQEISSINRYKSTWYQPSVDVDYLTLVSQETISAIQNTRSLLDHEQYDKALDLIRAAKQVYTIGLGISTYLAELTAYLLNRISIKATYLVYKGLTLTEQVVNLHKDDIIIAFSLPAYSVETIEAACYAQKRGIEVIAVTDKVTNEIVQYSTVLLQVDVDSWTPSNAIGGVIVMLYSLVTQISHDRKN